MYFKASKKLRIGMTMITGLCIYGGLAVLFFLFSKPVAPFILIFGSFQFTVWCWQAARWPDIHFQINDNTIEGPVLRWTGWSNGWETVLVSLPKSELYEGSLQQTFLDKISGTRKILGRNGDKIMISDMGFSRQQIQQIVAAVRSLCQITTAFN